MFGTILLSVAAAMTAFVFWRLGAARGLRRLSPRVRLGLAAAVWLVILAGREWGHGRAGTLPVLAELAGMNLLVAVFYAFLALAAVEAATVFGRLAPRLAPGLRALAVAAALVLSLAALVQGMRAPGVSRYEVALPGLPASLDGTTLAAVSDLHVGSVLGAGWLAARVEQIEALEPEMVVLLGDVFEGHDLPRDELLPVLSRLDAPLGVYAAQGNHEHYGRETSPLELLADAGIGVLVNRWTSPAPGLVVAGVEDLTIHGRRARADDPLEATLAGRPPGATILLSHTPLKVAEARAKGVGLMLSGHTHAGQVWPFGHLVGLRYPYLQGRFQVGPMTLIVSRGAGTWGPRMRLWRPGEILHLTLRAEHRTQGVAS